MKNKWHFRETLDADYTGIVTWIRTTVVTVAASFVIQFCHYIFVHVIDGRFIERVDVYGDVRRVVVVVRAIIVIVSGDVTAQVRHLTFSQMSFQVIGARKYITAKWTRLIIHSITINFFYRLRCRRCFENRFTEYYRRRFAVDIFFERTFFKII